MSSQALREYQAAQRPVETYTRREPSYGGSYNWRGQAARRPSMWGEEQPARSVARGPALPGAGPLTAVALWAALNSLSSPGSAEYFHNYQYDPGYIQWRREADREARSNPAVAAKLEQLDGKLAQMEGQPRNPAAAPPVQQAPARAGGAGFIGPVLVIGIVILLLLWLWRRRLAQPAASAIASGLTGSGAMRFRVGMTLPVDPSPFTLAAGSTKVQPPEGSIVSVETVGLLRDGAVLLHRLYLPGGEAFFQLHLGADGQPDECRYFSRLDDVTPADQREWGLWLDPAEGMIGWPSFQTKDSKLYGRVWAPGDNRVQPRQIEETLQYVDRVEQRQLQTMLYGAPTSLPAPAPETEYIFVAAVDAAGQAWVEIDAGIDINPAALNLPSVPLAA